MQQAEESVASAANAVSFWNKEVIAVRIDDPRVYGWPIGSQCWHMQWDDDPTLIVVGPRAKDSSLEYMAGRFGVPLQQLVDLRAAQAVAGAA